MSKDKKRRFQILLALQAAEEDEELPKTPEDLAALWGIDPLSAYRPLETLRKHGCVIRRGSGVTAEYEITEKGEARIRWAEEKGKI